MSLLYWQEVQPADCSPGRLLTFLALIQPFAEHLLRQIFERTNTIPGEFYSLKNDFLSNYSILFLSTSILISDG